MAEVWIVTYQNSSDEHDNGVVGVYTTEELAHAEAIRVVRKQPGFADARIKWKNGALWYYSASDRRWYEVLPRFQVEGWDVQGDPSAA